MHDYADKSHLSRRLDDIRINHEIDEIHEKKRPRITDRAEGGTAALICEQMLREAPKCQFVALYSEYFGPHMKPQISAQPRTAIAGGTIRGT